MDPRAFFTMQQSVFHVSSIIFESEYDIGVQAKTLYPVCTSASSTGIAGLYGIVTGSDDVQLGML